MTAMLACGFGVRCWLAWSTTQSDYELRIFHAWGRRLVHRPWAEFYAGRGVTDHLPGDLYLHAAIAFGHHANGPLGSRGAYDQSIKIVSALIDLVMGVLAYRLVCRRTGRRELALGAAALALLTPGIALISSSWGQFDNLSICLFLAFYLAGGDRGKRPIVSGALAAWCCLIKPQFALVFAGYVVVVLLREHWSRDAWRRTAVYAASGVVTAQLLMLPFNMGLVPGMFRWSLVERLQIANDVYPEASVLAANVWTLLLGVGRFPDSTRVGGVAAVTLAPVLVGLAFAIVVAVFAARRRDMPATWLGAMLFMSFVFFQVRMHDRYFFPVMFLLILLAVETRGRRRAWCVGLTVLFTVGFYFGIDGVHHALLDLRHRPWAIMLDAVVNAVVWLVMLAIPFVREDAAASEDATPQLCEGPTRAVATARSA